MKTLHRRNEYCSVEYNHRKMFAGVKNAWLDGAGCHWCGRKTRDELSGHDGFCPVPAIFVLEQELEAVMEERYHASPDECPSWYDNCQCSKDTCAQALEQVEMLSGMRRVYLVKALLKENEELKQKLREQQGDED